MSSIRVNGEAKEVSVRTVAELLAAESVDPTARFVAVAINGAVVPRGRWRSQPISTGDDVEIVKPAPGG